jgi:hypothetical protein
MRVIVVAHVASALSTRGKREGNPSNSSGTVSLNGSSLKRLAVWSDWELGGTQLLEQKSLNVLALAMGSRLFLAEGPSWSAPLSRCAGSPRPPGPAARAFLGVVGHHLPVQAVEEQPRGTWPLLPLHLPPSPTGALPPPTKAPLLLEGTGRQGLECSRADPCTV